MNRLYLLLAAAVAAPAFADPAPTELSFVRDGVEYHATSVEEDGIRKISGYEAGTNRKFDLRVQNGYVTGEYDGDRVSYSAPVVAPRRK